MKLCPHCSASLEDDTVRCSACGKWVIRGETGGGTRPRRRKSNLRLWVLVGLAALAMALWAMPEARIDPRELLDREPSRARVFHMVRKDLEKLAELEGRYFREHGEYSGSPAALGFSPSQQVTISIIATPGGWSGAATFQGYPRTEGCAVYVGSAAPPRAPVRPRNPGVIRCTAPAG